MLDNLRKAEPDSPDSANAIKHLLAFSDLINQAVGDSLSDMLMVEAVLAHRGWGAQEWNAAYEDLPNRLLKVEVPDRNIFVATDAERKLASPEGTQHKIEEAMRKVEMGRAFVRPSGTEDCVRVYAEASTNSQAEGRSSTGQLSSDGTRELTFSSTCVDYSRHCSTRQWSDLKRLSVPLHRTAKRNTTPVCIDNPSPFIGIPTTHNSFEFTFQPSHACALYKCAMNTAPQASASSGLAVSACLPFPS